jgi:RNA polymerase II subunit A small phosphatase-like protein
MKVDSFASENATEIVPVLGERPGELALNYRPFLFDFLEDMSRLYELVVYTSFSKDYLHAILKGVEKNSRYFAHSFHDEFCIFANIAYSVRCLDFLYANRSPADIVFVETSVKTLPLTPYNFIPIPVYDGSPTDSELPKLATLLTQLSTVDDIPTAVRKFLSPTV